MVYIDLYSLSIKHMGKGIYFSCWKWYLSLIGLPGFFCTKLCDNYCTVNFFNACICTWVVYHCNILWTALVALSPSLQWGYHIGNLLCALVSFYIHITGRLLGLCNDRGKLRHLQIIDWGGPASLSPLWKSRQAEWVTSISGLDGGCWNKSWCLKL